LFEVTQPRVTSYRVGIRMDEPQMAALLVAHGRPGFYFRVLEEGDVGADDEIVQIGAGAERMSVFEINALLYTSLHPHDELERGLRIPVLSAGWRISFQALLEQQRSGTTTGNAGLASPSGPPPAWSGFRPLRVTPFHAHFNVAVDLQYELPVIGELRTMAGKLRARCLDGLLDGPSDATHLVDLSFTVEAESLRMPRIESEPELLIGVTLCISPTGPVEPSGKTACWGQ
jgi:hypothetical protein